MDLYTLAEAKSKFTLSDLNNQILSFRRVQNAESVAINQLGISVKRLFVDSANDNDNIDFLRAGFNKGISVSPNHILANLDIRRKNG